MVFFTQQIAGTNQTDDGLYGARTGRLEAQASHEYIYDGADERGGLEKTIKATMVASNWGCIKSNTILPLGFANQYHNE